MPDYKPNISATGAARRRQMGWRFLVIWFAGVVLSIGLALPWWVRALLVVPAAVSAVYLVQARRMTCVLRAGEGTFEGDDMSTTAAPAADATASRQVAFGIWRDTLLLGALGGLLAIATVWIR